MRGHFRFLKDHRKVLNLKVNATEDLLLNGAREPTHRGVCQHLLDKVERSRVEAVVQRLEPPARVRLLEGIIGFSPDVAYLLLYLESLRDAARDEATPALSAALKRLDFAAVSPAQMRRVLDLIVELHDARDRPQLMFSLLQSATFRSAFDSSAESLPEGLADVVVPLRAVHAVVLRDKKNPFDAAALGRGVEMLLSGREKVLRAQPLAIRQRLFDAGIELSEDRACAPGLRALADSFPADERAASESKLRLAGWLLARGLEQDARAVLTALRREHPGFKRPARWLAALEGPRVGGIGLTEAAEGRRSRGRDWWQSGVLLSRQLPVWVCVAKPEDGARVAQAVQLSRSVAVPGVAAVLESGTTREGAPYFATRRLGRGANELILAQGALARERRAGIVWRGSADTRRSCGCGCRAAGRSLSSLRRGRFRAPLASRPDGRSEGGARSCTARPRGPGTRALLGRVRAEHAFSRLRRGARRRPLG